MALAAMARAHRLSQLFQHLNRQIPRYAGVRYALSVDERLVGFLVLPSLDEVAFQHNANAIGAGRNLRGNIFGHERLAGVVFAAIAMAAVHHDAMGQSRLSNWSRRCLYIGSGVVKFAVTAAATTDMSQAARRCDNSGNALLVTEEKWCG